MSILLDDEIVMYAVTTAIILALIAAVVPPGKDQ